MARLKMLFSPFKIGTMELKNRIIMGPQGTNLSEPDGSITEQQIAHYEARARGGVGLIITEMTVIDPRGRYQSRVPEISSDKHIQGWSNVAKAVHAHGAKIVIQLGHAGRETSPAYIGGLQPVAPSAVPPPVTKLIPKELTVDEIKDLVSKYAQAAWRAREAVVDGIEVHGAHCYLMAAFMSPVWNKRSDAYGGGLEGRMRFPLEVISAIRERVGRDFPLIFRITADEMIPGGRGLEETKVICRMLVEAGVDAIEVSRGSLVTLRWVVPPMGTPIALNVPYAAAIKEVVDVPIMVVGRINDPTVAEHILETQKADLIVMSRALLVDPDFPNKAAAGNFEDIVPCIACTECLQGVMGEQPVTCLMNPMVGMESDMAIVPATKPKRVLVVGGGPAGLEASMVASLRGHQVTLYDKADRLGGQLNIAAVPPAKQELTKAIKYLSTQVEKSGVKVEIGKEVTPELIGQSKPDVVIIATGASPLIPDIPGVKYPKVVTANDVLSGKVAIGSRALIIGGGMVGSETADYLSELTADVTLLEMLEDIATDMVVWQKEFLLERLAMRGVKIITSAKVKEILDDGAIFTKEGKEDSIRGMDNIIIAMGAKSVNELSAKIKGKVSELYIIGDAFEPRKALEAIREGAEVGRKI